MKWMIDYKTCQNLADKIESFIPNRIDIYYDNVGGELLDVKISLNNIEYDDPFSYFVLKAVLPHMADHGRILASGS